MRLINAEEVIMRLRVDPEEWGTPDESWLPEREYAMAIMTSPEIDPVQHGRWVDDYNETEHPLFRKAWKCSVCGFRTSYGKPKFCMNCGAQMDGESDE